MAGSDAGEESGAEAALASSLYEACKEGDLGKAKLLLAAGAEPACRDEQGVTPLMLAAELGAAELVEALLEAGAPWHDQDAEGNTAGEYGMRHKPVLHLLLEWGVQSELALGTISGRERPAGEAVNAEYLSSTVRYDDADGRLMDAEGEAVMMGWEAPLMERHADAICAAGGDVLNVGFGMGIIDEAIQRRRPRSHTIIEAHPDVHRRMLALGWGDKPGVKVVFGRWQDVLAELGPFDGVFFDTYGEYYDEMREFHAALPRLLRPGAVYSFFNGLAPDNLFFHMVYGEIARRELNALGLSVKYEPVPIDASADSVWAGVKNRYWHFPVYFHPTCIMGSAPAAEAGAQQVENTQAAAAGVQAGKSAEAAAAADVRPVQSAEAAKAKSAQAQRAAAPDT